MCKVPYNCETCGEEVKILYGSGRFCCQSCSNKRNHSEETKQKMNGLLVTDFMCHANALRLESA